MKVCFFLGKKKMTCELSSSGINTVWMFPNKSKDSFRLRVRHETNTMKTASEAGLSDSEEKAGWPGDRLQLREGRASAAWALLGAAPRGSDAARSSRPGRET